MENEVARRLREDAQEIDRSLDEFMRNRAECVAQQARALEDYNEEMARIRDEHDGLDEQTEEDVERTDHNLNRHLALSKKADYDPDEYPEYDEGADNEGGYENYDEGPSNSRFQRNYVDVPKKEFFDKGLVPKPAVPSQAQKEQMREAVFGLLNKTQTEEMQLLLEYERKREEVGAFRAEYLAEGLYTVQKGNYHELKDMIVDYQPQGFGKAWGNDPDYVRMSEELKNRLGKLDTEEAAANTDIANKGGGGGKAKKVGKRKKGGQKH